MNRMRVLLVLLSIFFAVSTCSAQQPRRTQYATYGTIYIVVPQYVYPAQTLTWPTYYPNQYYPPAFYLRQDYYMPLPTRYIGMGQNPHYNTGGWHK